MAALCADAAALSNPARSAGLLCDVAGVTTPDLRTVEALARITLTVRRAGGTVLLRGASVELLDLLAFCGLAVRLSLEAEGDAEEREEASGVQEEGDAADPVA
jgi:hypothetical protein